MGSSLACYGKDVCVPFFRVSDFEFDTLPDFDSDFDLSSLEQEIKDPCAIAIIHFVLSEPDELLEVIDHQHKARGVVLRRMRQDGFSWPKIWRAFRLLKKIL